MLESIPTHYTSLGFLKLPKIIKLNVAHVCFFIIISIMNACMASADLLLGINELSLAWSFVLAAAVFLLIKNIKYQK